MPEGSVTRRSGRLFRAVLAGAALLILAGYLVILVRTSGHPAECTVRTAGGGSHVIELEQASNAATIQAVASARQLPERAVVIALATAMQESGLRNIDHGDRDSVGLFQQRPSQGWGTVTQIMDPVYSAGMFYDHLVEIPGYTELPLTDAAQRVQRSAFPLAYAKHEPDAALLAAALTGRQSAAFFCNPGTDRKPGDAASVRQKLTREFGAAVRPRETAGPDGGRGKAARPVLTVPVRTEERGARAPRSGAAVQRRGWELAHWAVAHATELGIERITYRDRVWTADDAPDGWRKNAGQPSADVRLTMAR